MTKLYIVDASTTLKWIFEDEINSDKALNLLKDYLLGKVRLLAPNLWVFEIANAIVSATFANRQVKKNTKKKIRQILKLAPSIVNIEEEIEICLETSIKYQVSIYDSCYVTLALTNKIQLISSDDKLIKKIKNKNIALPLGEYESPPGQ